MVRLHWSSKVSNWKQSSRKKFSGGLSLEWVASGLPSSAVATWKKINNNLMKMSMLKTTVIRFSTHRLRKTLKWPVLWVETWAVWRMTSPIISDRWRAMQASQLVVTRAKLSTCMTLMRSLTAMMLWRTREKSIKPLPKSSNSKTSKRSVTLSRSPLSR